MRVDNFVDKIVHRRLTGTHQSVGNLVREVYERNTLIQRRFSSSPHNSQAL
jgi:hypothetical protein